MLQIEFQSEFHGPNPFTPDAALVAKVVPARPLEPRQLQALAAAALRMAEAWPEWVDAGSVTGDDAVLCATRAIVRWSLGALNEVRGYLHEAGARRDEDGVRMWIAFHHAPTTHKAIELATQVLRAGVSGPLDRAAFRSPLEALWLQCRHQHPDFQARVLMEGARTAGIPVLPFLRPGRMWQFGWGARSRFFLESTSNEDGYLGSTLQRSKAQTKALFARLGMPTPRAVQVAHPQELEGASKVIGFPCVLKPEDRGGGKGVTADIRSMEQLQAAFVHARGQSSQPLLLEKHVPGDDHRIMVLDGQVHAVTLRQSSWVTGDGSSTVGALLAALNGERSSNMVKSHYLRPVPIDEVVTQQLAAQGLTMDSVPEAGRRVILRSNANLSTGGIGTDVTHLIHPGTRALAEMFASTLGLAHTGLDYITTDIAKPWHEGGGFIEANSTPGLDAIIAAGHDPIALALAVLGRKPGRIPVQVAVLDNRDVLHAMAHLRQQAVPPEAGWACAGQAQVGATPLALAMPTLRAATNALLVNQTVARALVVCAVGELQRDGFPVDRADTVFVSEAVKLDTAWSAALGRHAGEVKAFTSWPELVAASVLFGR